MGTLDIKEIAPQTGEAKERLFAEIREQYRGNSLINQRSRLLKALTRFPVTTLEARKYLDIMHPAGRVMELRRCGWRVDTLWTVQEAEAGKRHRIAVYVFGGRADE